MKTTTTLVFDGDDKNFDMELLGLYNTLLTGNRLEEKDLDKLDKWLTKLSKENGKIVKMLPLTDRVGYLITFEDEQSNIVTK